MSEAEQYRSVIESIFEYAVSVDQEANPAMVRVEASCRRALQGKPYTPRRGAHLGPRPAEMLLRGVRAPS